jgi:hypothetical protein
MSLYYHPPLFIILTVGWFTSSSSYYKKHRTRAKEENPVSYAFKYLNSPETQRQYPKRLKLPFDHVGLTGDSLEAQGQAFLDKTRENPQWAQEKIIDFIHFHKQRVLRKEIAAGTLINFFLSIKLFCEMNDITTINWKRLSRALQEQRAILPMIRLQHLKKYAS